MNFQNGSSPVFIASQSGHTDIVDLLIDTGADINLTTIEVLYDAYIHIRNTEGAPCSDSFSFLYTLCSLALLLWELLLPMDILKQCGLC